MDFRLLSSSRLRTPAMARCRWRSKDSVDERVRSSAESRPARLQTGSTPVSGGMFLRLHQKIPGMRIGAEPAEPHGVTSFLFCAATNCGV
jgi:hypothetical protein